MLKSLILIFGLGTFSQLSQAASVGMISVGQAADRGSVISGRNFPIALRSIGQGSQSAEDSLTSMNIADEGIHLPEASAVVEFEFLEPLPNILGPDFYLFVHLDNLEEGFEFLVQQDGAFTGGNRGSRQITGFSGMYRRQGRGSGSAQESSPELSIQAVSFDLSDAGVLRGESVNTVRITNLREGVLVFGAGSVVPEPNSIFLSSVGIVFLLRRRRLI